MPIQIYQVDAFTNIAFKGNPAAVCILEKELEEEMMQAIAYEMNLSETAFVIQENNGEEKTNEFKIRWFTPNREVPLCGHATLAASEVLFNQLNIPFDEIIYRSKSGILKAQKDVYGISLDFPIDEAIDVPLEQFDDLLKAIGISKYRNIFLGKKTKKLVIHLESVEEILQVNPNYELMTRLDIDNIKGVGVTTYSGEENDIISRYFNPWAGVNEDSVTGSVHTLLASYWSEILGKNELKAYQASKRGGSMVLRIKENKRLDMIGEAKTILRGVLDL
ncbi:PhzF family phenazine biosynthesis protein [Wukongibacter baidiensis]|uniref:PhzF family phenazine biosynthesis protein n=1 Tax=Wukongibacter baidiensis TaxID=1723361 RepID=UPI003D7F7554